MPLPILRKYAFAVALSLVPGTAAFAVSTWDFSSCNSNTANNSTGGAAAFGNTWTCSGSNGGGNAAVSGWSTTGASSTFQSAYVSPQGTSGFGIADQSEGLSPSSPSHGADNAGSTDMFALNFGAKVDLTAVSIGWYQTDSDLSVLRYAGDGAPTVSGQSIANLLSSGWKLVGDYTNVHLKPNDTQAVNTADGSIGPNDGSSNWWVISAYNSSYSAPQGISQGNDFFKLLSVAGNLASPPPSTGVSEPVSIALVGLAMLGAAGGRRRMRRSNQELAAPV